MKKYSDTTSWHLQMSAYFLNRAYYIKTVKEKSKRRKTQQVQGLIKKLLTYAFKE